MSKFPESESLVQITTYARIKKGSPEEGYSLTLPSILCVESGDIKDLPPMSEEARQILEVLFERMDRELAERELWSLLDFEGTPEKKWSAALAELQLIGLIEERPGAAYRLVLTPKLSALAVIDNRHPLFYGTMGPFLARRHIVQSNGDTPLWDDDGLIWAIALNQGGKVMGFAALSPGGKGQNVLLCNDYVLPRFRDDQNKVQGSLVEALLARCPENTTVTVVAGANEKEFYEEKGFSQQGKKGSFLVMRKSMSGARKG